MKVCVGITTKNRRAILSNAIESALKQDYPNIEIFVFDDGSTDDTFSLNEQYPQVRWERVENSVGLLEARNQMMRSSDADIFVSLDDDGWFLKGDEISIAVVHFDKQPKLGAVAFDILEIKSPRSTEVEREPAVPTNFYKGAGHALRLSAVKEAGYYVPFPLKYGHEEKDLGILILNKGYHILFLPGVHVWHDITPMSRNKYEQSRAFVINDLIYKFRRVPMLFMAPVLGVSIMRTLQGRVRKNVNNKEAVKTFFKLLPGQLKYVDRVKISTYRNYRNLSNTYLSFLAKSVKTEAGNSMKKPDDSKEVRKQNI